jgi:hypothetical protein
MEAWYGMKGTIDIRIRPISAVESPYEARGAPTP